MNIRLALIPLLLGTAVPAWANDAVPYVPMSLCEVEPYASARDFWDATGLFCFESKNHRFTYPVSSLREVDLRSEGHWAANAYVDHLSEDSRAIAGEYSKYSIRYLALDDGTKGLARPFVTQVLYDWMGSTMTTYVFGEIDPAGVVRLTGFSDGGTGDGAVRSAIAMVENIFTIFRGRDPNREAVDQTKAQDRLRIRPVRDVVTEFTTTAPGFGQP